MAWWRSWCACLVFGISCCFASGIITLWYFILFLKCRKISGKVILESLGHLVNFQSWSLLISMDCQKSNWQQELFLDAFIQPIFDTLLHCSQIHGIFYDISFYAKSSRSTGLANTRALLWDKRSCTNRPRSSWLICYHICVHSLLLLTAHAVNSPVSKDGRSTA